MFVSRGVLIFDDNYTFASIFTQNFLAFREILIANGTAVSRQVEEPSRDQRKRWRPDAEWSEKASWRLVRWNGVALAPAFIQFSILVSLHISFVYFCFSFSPPALSFFVRQSNSLYPPCKESRIYL